MINKEGFSSGILEGGQVQVEMNIAGGDRFEGFQK